MTKSITLSAQIPFSGFHESAHSDNIDRAIEDYFDKEGTGEGHSLIPDDFYFSFEHYRTINEEYAKLYVKLWVTDFRDKTGIDLKPITFEEMRSPREYNFETDRLFVTLTLKTIKAMRAYVDDTTLAAHIKDRCTSYDGFYSFYSNDFEEWQLKPLKEWDHNELGILIEAALIQSGVESRLARWGGNDYDIMEYALCNGLIDNIVYPYCEEWEEKHPNEDKRAALFLDITDYAWTLMNEEEKAEAVIKWQVATYHCSNTPDLFTNV